MQGRANESFALGMYTLNSNFLAKSVVSNFQRPPCVASSLFEILHAPVYFALASITVAEIRDYLQSTRTQQNVMKKLLIRKDGKTFPQRYQNFYQKVVKQ